MKFSVERIPEGGEEAVLVCCHDPEAPWVEAIRAVAAGELTIAGRRVLPVLQQGGVCLPVQAV